MKCENCGKNEVTFYYKSSVNGKVTEKHLCSECAERLGYAQNASAFGRQMMRSFWDGSLLDSFFSPAPRMSGGMGRFGEDLFDDFFNGLPALCAAPSAQEESASPEEPGELVDQKEESRFSRMRQLNALRMEMKKAVREENFEHAAELRDQIHALEQKKQENG